VTRPAWNEAPPADVEPSRLFRSLLRYPYPIAPLAHRLSFAPDTSLHVRALRADEWDEVHESDERAHVLVGLALCDESGRALTSPDDAFDWTARELDRCAIAVLGVLSRISPTYRKSDHLAWNSRLVLGARIANATARSLAAYEVAGDRIVEVPERYFGGPKRLLTDGHWMAYRAALSVTLERG
jgi:hypothetical protein